MDTTRSHHGESELLVKPPHIRFGGDVAVPESLSSERTKQLENDEEEDMENML